MILSERFFGFITSRYGKWITVISWILISGILISTAPPLKESTQATDWLPSSAESTKAFKISVENFPQAGLPVIIVFRNQEVLSELDYDAAREIDSWLESNQ